MRDRNFWVVAIVGVLLLVSWWISSANESTDSPRASLTPDFKAENTGFITTTGDDTMEAQ